MVSLPVHVSCFDLNIVYTNMSGMTGSAGALTNMVVSHDLVGVSLYLWPVIGPLQQHQRLRLAWVAGCGCLMVHPQQPEVQWFVLGNIQLMAVFDATPIMGAFTKGDLSAVPNPGIQHL